MSWSGSDNPGGSGVAAYTVYGADNGGSFTPFLADSVADSATSHGRAGHTYAFYSVDSDVAGNTQPTPIAAQAMTRGAAGPDDFNGDGIIDVGIYQPNKDLFAPDYLNAQAKSIGQVDTAYGFHTPGTFALPLPPPEGSPYGVRAVRSSSVRAVAARLASEGTIEGSLIALRAASQVDTSVPTATMSRSASTPSASTVPIRRRIVAQAVVPSRKWNDLAL